jgi:hypothetical protein
MKNRFRPEDEGAVPGKKDAGNVNREAFEDVCLKWLAQGGTLELADNATYHISGGIKALSNASTTKSQFCRLEGNGATLAFNTDGNFYSFLLGGEAGDPLWNEHGYLVVRDLQLTHLGAGGEARQSYGMSIQNCRNVRVDLERVTCYGFRINFHFQRNWPLAMRMCKSLKARHAALWCDTGMTTAIYEGCEFLESRYGVVLWTNGPISIFNQTFRNCRFETLEGLGILNAARGEAIRNVSFIDTYAENWGRPLAIGFRSDDLDKSPIDSNWPASLKHSDGPVKGTSFDRGWWNNERCKGVFPEHEAKFMTGSASEPVVRP